MNESEIKAAFAAFDKAHPFYRAVLALLEAEVVNEAHAACSPNLGDGGRHYNAGRLAHALDMRNVFNGVMREALAEQVAAVQRAERAAARREATDS